MSNDSEWGCCPFCGNRKGLRRQVEAHIEGGCKLYIQCDVCQARGPEVLHKGDDELLQAARQETVARWDVRHLGFIKTGE